MACSLADSVVCRVGNPSDEANMQHVLILIYLWGRRWGKGASRGERGGGGG